MNSMPLDTSPFDPINVQENLLSSTLSNGSPLEFSGLSSDDDIPISMDWTTSSHDSPSPTTPISTSKRKPFDLPISPRAILGTETDSYYGPPRKKARQVEGVTPRTSDTRRKPQPQPHPQPHHLQGGEEAASPLPESSPLELGDTLVSALADVERSLDSILSLPPADDTLRQEFSHPLPASVSPSAPFDSEIAVTEKDAALHAPLVATDVFLNPYDDASSGEDRLFQALFEKPSHASNSRIHDTTSTREPDATLEADDGLTLNDIFDDDTLLSASFRDLSMQQEVMRPGQSSTEYTPKPTLEQRHAESELPMDVAVSAPDPRRDDFLFDSEGLDDMDSEPFSTSFEPEPASSRCPCSRCSPNAVTHPDYCPSPQSQQDIHRLFSLGPFARGL
ncbi:hypothetical protein C8R43DRAFT_1051367 [Mycena crocata]|nr:hypothetical protein C8R43DRAFT_1051367 [Mycena crocata]